MKIKHKKLLSIFLIFTFILSINTSVFADTVSGDAVYITAKVDNADNLSVEAGKDWSTQVGVLVARSSNDNSTPVFPGTVSGTASIDGNPVANLSSYSWTVSAYDIEYPITVSGKAPTTPGQYTYKVYFTSGNTTLTSNSDFVVINVSVTAPTGKITPTVNNWPTATSITYGQTLVNSTLNGGSASVSGRFVFDDPATAPIAGTNNFPVTFIPTDTTRYNTVPGTINVIVNKAVLTVTSDDKTKVYGDVNPALTATTVGLVNDDTLASLDITLSTTADKTSGAGNYDIIVSHPDLLANYIPTYNNGTLTVSKAALAVTADNKTKVYGDVNPALTTTTVGLVNNDTLASLDITLSTTADKTSGVGTYDIIVNHPDSLANYSPTYNNGTLTVSKATLAVTADNKTKTYGEDNPPLTATVSGLANGDNLATLGITLSTSAAKISGAGNYDIIVIHPDSLANYNPTYNNGTLTVNKADLTVTAENKSKTYGEDNPNLTATTLGLVNGDTLDSLHITLSTSAAKTSGAGNYDIIVIHPDLLANYNPTYNNGALTVNKADLTVTAENKSKTYGEDNPDLTATTLGLVNGDTLPLLNITLSTSADVKSGAGTYDITVSGPSTLDNYIPTYTNGKLTVNKAALTVTADDKSKTYGEANPALTAATVGLVNGDTLALLNITLSTSADVKSGAGTYDITLSGPSTLNNYIPTYTKGTLTVNKAILTVTADDKSRIYGTANPLLTYHIDGFVNGDTEALISGTPVLSCTANETTPVSTVPITIAQGTLSADNYLFAMVNGKLTINPYDFSGFFQPINMGLNVVNTVKAGSAVPIKFTLHGDFGLNIIESGYPQVLKASISQSGLFIAGIDIDAYTVTAGSSSLSYDPVSDQYTYVWKTQKSWANSCKQLVVKLKDGTTQTANFYFK